MDEFSLTETEALRTRTEGKIDNQYLFSNIFMLQASKSCDGINYKSITVDNNY